MGGRGKLGPVGRSHRETLIGRAGCRFCRTDEELECARQRAGVVSP